MAERVLKHRLAKRLHRDTTGTFSKRHSQFRLSFWIVVGNEEKYVHMGGHMVSGFQYAVSMVKRPSIKH